MNILKQFIGADQVDDTKILLKNAQYLRARNAANSGNVNLLRVNASDIIEFASLPQYSGSNLATEAFVNARDVASYVPKALVTTDVTVSNPGTAVFDSVTLTAGQLLFLAGQSTQTENGLWTFNTSGTALTRPAGWTTGSTIAEGTLIIVDHSAGSNSDQIWKIRDAAVIGTDSVVADLSSSGDSGANTALSNLTATSINQDLVFDEGSATRYIGWTTQPSSTMNLVIQAGTPINSNGGTLTLLSGGSNLATGGAALFGSADQGNNNNTGSGTVTIKSGDGAPSSATGDTGNLTLRSGLIQNDAASGNSGYVFLGSGAVGAGSGNSGAVNIYSGDNAGTGNTGIIQIYSGSAVGGGNSGAVTIGSGNADQAQDGEVSGQVQILTGQAYEGSGPVLINTGNSTKATGAYSSGDINLTTGSVASAAASGAITLTTGNTTTGVQAGTISLIAGNDGAGLYGQVNVIGGMVDIIAYTAFRLISANGLQPMPLRFMAGNNETWIDIVAPATIPSNVSFILPAADGTAGQALKTDGAGNLSFGDAGGTWAKERIALSATDITNQYIDLAHVAKTDSIMFMVKGGNGMLIEGAGDDYSVNYTGGAGGNTRITFLNDIATGGPSALTSSNIVVVQYEY
jgi:hypothetical protein